MANFYDVRFPDDLGYLARGGREFKTIITEQENGYEQRNQNLSSTRGRWTINGGLLTKDNVGPLGIFNLINFHNAMRGRLYGFRFKDFQDYKASINTGTIGKGVGTGFPSYQLGKKYTVGDASFISIIKKPVEGTVTVYKNNIEITGDNYAVDYNNGLINFFVLPYLSVVKKSTTAGFANVVTDKPHGYTQGDFIYFKSTADNRFDNRCYMVQVVLDQNTFTIGDVDVLSDINVKCYKYPQPNDELKASFEFDFPVRFDNDIIDKGQDEAGFISIDTITLVELKI